MGQQVTKNTQFIDWLGEQRPFYGHRIFSISDPSPSPTPTPSITPTLTSTPTPTISVTPTISPIPIFCVAQGFDYGPKTVEYNNGYFYVGGANNGTPTYDAYDGVGYTLVQIFVYE